MPIQPYFPEPISVPGNVAGAKHRLRVAFVRRVVGWHCLAMALVGFLAWLVPLSLPLAVSSLCFVGGLIALTIVRRAFDGTSADSALSMAFLIPTLFSLSQCLRALHDQGWPILVLVPVTFSIGLYVLLCGNDLSYIGQFCLCSLFTLASVVVAVAVKFWSQGQGLIAMSLAIAYLFYFVYDLSMLVKRRRIREETAAVADLFRDLINFATYLVRVYLHWKRFPLI